MGMIVSVYRDANGVDATNGGLSSKVNNFVVTNVDGPFDPTDDMPAAVLAAGPFNTARIYPTDYLNRNDGVVTFGGNLAFSCDSRFNDALKALKTDHAFLMEGGVFSQELIQTWINYKMENEIRELYLRPHPHEFHLYYDS